MKDRVIVAIISLIVLILILLYGYLYYYLVEKMGWPEWIGWLVVLGAALLAAISLKAAKDRFIELKEEEKDDLSQY